MVKHRVMNYQNIRRSTEETGRKAKSCIPQWEIEAFLAFFTSEVSANVATGISDR